MRLQMQKAKAGKLATTTVVDLPFMLPHMVFSWYYHNDKAMFKQLFMGCMVNRDDINGFWAEVKRRGDPRLARPPHQYIAQGSNTMALPWPYMGTLFQCCKSDGQEAKSSMPSTCRASSLKASP